MYLWSGGDQRPVLFIFHRARSPSQSKIWHTILDYAQIISNRFMGNPTWQWVADLLGVRPPHQPKDKKQNFGLKMMWLMNRVAHIPPGADKATLCQYARYYLFMLIGDFHLHTSHPTLCPLRWLPLLEVFNSCRRVVWRDVMDIAGCVLLVMSWIYHRFLNLCCNNKNTRDNHHEIGLRLRCRMDDLRFDEFHHVDKVKRQLGGQQHRPEDPTFHQMVQVVGDELGDTLEMISVSQLGRPELMEGCQPSRMLICQMRRQRAQQYGISEFMCQIDLPELYDPMCTPPNVMDDLAGRQAFHIWGHHLSTYAHGNPYHSATDSYTVGLCLGIPNV
ncbi:hypothetical protein Ahy_A08g039935 [Arachis hypogaea]|uniref:Aminotransferase-like plant mobile domain-containing protein n=1 Tax=Arachis hypogaea TaxID=3818 RepID=A0A445BY22_ARAHY|nr:hypothetical protein Ahy_A08g039935 [Arachis hypogaea]